MMARLSILTGIVLCWTVLISGCNKHHDSQLTADGSQAAAKNNPDHPNTDQATSAAVKALVAAVEKSLATLPPPPSAPPVCEGEMAKVREVSKTALSIGEAADANSALLRCISSATNEANCKGKSQPCGVVYFNPLTRPSDTELSAPKAIDVSVPDQIAAACKEIAGAGGADLSTSSGAEPARGVILGSLIGRYSCGAWFKAAAKNDPTILIVPGFAPTIPLLRDLKRYTNGVADVTSEAALANTVKRVDRTLVTVSIGGAYVPVGVLPIVPIGDLDEACKSAQKRVNQTGKAVEDNCKLADICR